MYIIPVFVNTSYVIKHVIKHVHRHECQITKSRFFSSECQINCNLQNHNEEYL